MKVYSVAQINSYIGNLIGMDGFLNGVLVQGEISNLKYHSSGHIYFTLKDEKSSISCIMFASHASGLRFRMKEGMQILCSGEIKVFERDGKYQLYVVKAEPAGTGLLNEKFEQLKVKLEEMGLFSEEYKRAIPSYVKKLGVVTAPTGAAIRDIIQIAKRRNPYIEIILYPALVQGENAADSIVKGIEALQQCQPDVIIIGRGGGSLEDLWAFNEERTAMAVFQSKIPIISAVGHETDKTITDYVADLRAPTPSAAAELAVCDINAFFRTLEMIKSQLTREIRNRTENERQNLKNKESKLHYLGPVGNVREKRMCLITKEDKLKYLMKSVLENRKKRLLIDMEKMKGLSPVEKLSQGYSVVMKETGKTISNASDITEGEHIMIVMNKGSVEASVIRVTEGSIIDMGCRISSE